MKIVQVVWGSEDGNLGVYTSFKKAFLRAKLYLEQNGETLNISLKEAKENRYHLMADGDKSYCSITEFILNLE